VLKAVVDEVSKTNNDRTRLRDALFGFISLDVWMQLAKSAAIAVSQGEDDEVMPLYDSILNSISRRIGRTKESIKEAFLENEGNQNRDIQLALQHYLTVARRQADLVSEIADKNSGGD
jgi:hypothetical protein